MVVLADPDPDLCDELGAADVKPVLPLPVVVLVVSPPAVWLPVPVDVGAALADGSELEPAVCEPEEPEEPQERPGLPEVSVGVVDDVDAPLVAEEPALVGLVSVVGSALGVGPALVLGLALAVGAPPVPDPAGP